LKALRLVLRMSDLWSCIFRQKIKSNGLIVTYQFHKDLVGGRNQNVRSVSLQEGNDLPLATVFLKNGESVTLKIDGNISLSGE